MESKENWDDDNTPATDNYNPTNEDIQISQVLPGYATFDDYLTDAFAAMRAGIKAANNLPSGENYRYYSCFPSFRMAKEKDITLLLESMQYIINAVGVAGNVKKRELEEKFELLLETNDVLLDRANIRMDEESGISRNPEIELIVSQARKEPINGSWNTVSFASQNSSGNSHNSEAVRLLTAKNIQRPQISFKDKIDNTSKPWFPRIKDKPNSLKPLAIYVEEGENGEVFSHPYEFELDKFQPPDNLMIKKTPVKYKPLQEVPLIMIEKSEDIDILLDDLKKYNEIAVDLEHHSYRTFQGITCLMQISTGDTDYIIDTLSLRSELYKLNEIFTKPSILKVFHGADSDILWLQRDLSLYIVNMFDTHQAAKQLNLPYLSLAYLLKLYCNIDPNKHFQLADWRIRPLPDELIKYAREDTHYLLHIKDVLRNDLIDSANGQINILKSVFDRSTEICKKTYVKPIWTEESYMNMYRKSHKMFNNKQLWALRELHKWRDMIARLEDDSIGYVLPNHMLVNIAEALPREMQGILACCNPIPPLVRQNLLRLHKIILTAREQPLIKPILEDDIRKRLTQRTQLTNSEAWIYAPHDVPNGTEARADLPCLLEGVNLKDVADSNITTKHTITVFDSPVGSENEKLSPIINKTLNKKKFVFVSPFERYKQVMPMIAEQEAIERERQKKLDDEKVEKVKQDAAETTNSITRVHEHFQKVAYGNTSVVPNLSKGKVPLSQMPGRKRKRDSDMNKSEKCNEVDNNLTTPIPSLKMKITQGLKQGTNNVEHVKAEQDIHRTLEQIRRTEPVKPIRQRKKGAKKSNNKELMARDMLPSGRFDYKSVDFSSFQGGSLGSESNRMSFDQKTKLRKHRPKKRKKQKLNI